MWIIIIVKRNVIEVDARREPVIRKTVHRDRDGERRLNDHTGRDACVVYRRRSEKWCRQKKEDGGYENIRA